MYRKSPVTPLHLPRRVLALLSSFQWRPAYERDYDPSPTGLEIGSWSRFRIGGLGSGGESWHNASSDKDAKQLTSAERQIGGDVGELDAWRLPWGRRWSGALPLYCETCCHCKDDRRLAADSRRVARQV
jgi:hypothetical protein